MLGIYTRLSKDDDDSNSIYNQKREAYQYIEDNKVPDYEIYDEGKGFSGTLRIKERPKLNELINDIEAGKITSVWMRRQDRLARLGITVLTFADAIVRNDVHLFFGDKGHINLNDPIQMFHLTVMAGVDALKPAQQSKATKRALTDNAKEGKVSGILPYGYGSKNMYPYIREDEKKIINRIYDLYIEGNGTQAIATILNKENIPTKYQRMVEETNNEKLTSNRKHRNGVIWQSSTVYGILKNTWYNGLRTYQGVEYDMPQLRIVDEVKYNKVQKARELRKNKRFDDRPKYDYLLRGLIKCHKCGRNFIGRTRLKKNDNFYHCSSKRSGVSNCGAHSINISKLDSFIIKHLFTSKNLINRLKDIQNSNEIKRQLDNDINIITNKLKKEEARLTKYAKWLGDELQDDEIILKQYVNSKKQVKTLKEKLSELNVQKADTSNHDALNKYEKIFKEFNAKADFQTIKKAVHKLVESVTIDSIIDLNKQLVFIIGIDYVGFNESSIFSTVRPYKKWLYTSNTRLKPRPDELQRDVDLVEHFYKERTGKELKIAKNNYHLHKQDFYQETLLEPIILNKEDLVDFNKQNRKTS